MDQVEFYKMAMTPEFGDAMNFELTATDIDTQHTFSRGSVAAIAEQVRNFMLARIVAQYDTGSVPRRMAVTVSLDFDGVPVSEREYGFYTAESSSDFLEIDGLRRLKGVDKQPE